MSEPPTSAYELVVAACPRLAELLVLLIKAGIADPGVFDTIIQKAGKNGTAQIRVAALEECKRYLSAFLYNDFVSQLRGFPAPGSTRLPPWLTAEIWKYKRRLSEDEVDDVARSVLNQVFEDLVVRLQRGTWASTHLDALREWLWVAISGFQKGSSKPRAEKRYAIGVRHAATLEDPKDIERLYRVHALDKPLEEQDPAPHDSGQPPLPTQNTRLPEDIEAPEHDVQELRWLPEALAALEGFATARNDQAIRTDAFELLKYLRCMLAWGDRNPTTVSVSRVHEPAGHGIRDLRREWEASNTPFDPEAHTRHLPSLQNATAWIAAARIAECEASGQNYKAGQVYSRLRHLKNAWDKWVKDRDPGEFVRRALATASYSESLQAWRLHHVKKHQALLPTELDEASQITALHALYFLEFAARQERKLLVGLPRAFTEAALSGNPLDKIAGEFGVAVTTVIFNLAGALDQIRAQRELG